MDGLRRNGVYDVCVGVGLCLGVGFGAGAPVGGIWILLKQEGWDG